MVSMTNSFSHWCFTYHKDIYVPLVFGHTELLTADLYCEYLDWIKTDEAKPYLIEDAVRQGAVVEESDI
jgi:hypothetical protein